MKKDLNKHSISVISILHDMREVHEKKGKFSLTIFYALLGILIIDVVSIFAWRPTGLDTGAWTGIWFLILGMGFFMSDNLKEKNWCKSIDDFYLQKALNIENERKNQEMV
jgi:hypothetical protein